jgi:hypothetical protein
MLSPGVLYSCFELLEITGRYELKYNKYVQNIKNINLFRSHEALELNLALGFFQKAKNGKIVLSAQGSKLNHKKDYGHFLSKALLIYSETFKPYWLKYSLYGREKVLRFCSNEIRQIINEAKLDIGESAETVLFWDKLAEIARDIKKGDNLYIGRLGERISLKYEKERVKAEPTWMAIEDNSAGYDILSIKDVYDEAKVKIEVKTTMLKNGKFFLTKNEWEEANLSKNYLFYLWNLSQINKPMIGIINKEEVAVHIPKEQNLGEWCQTEIPFSAFIGKMKPCVSKQVLETLSEYKNI